MMTEDIKIEIEFDLEKISSELMNDSSIMSMGKYLIYF